MSNHVLTELIYSELGPFTRFEDQTDFALLKFVEAWAGSYLGDLYEIVRDTDEHPGWGVLFDPDDAPVEALDYLAQFVGGVLTPVMSEAERRQEIKTPATWRRGGVDELIEAVKRTLTNSKTVVLIERHEGSAWRLWVRTLSVETPDPSETERVLRENKVIGIVLLYEAVEGQSWFDVYTNHSTWNEVLSEYDTWEDLVIEQSA